MKKRFLRKVVIGFILLFALGVVAMFGFYWAVKGGIFGPLPSDADLNNISNATATEVFSADEKLIGKIFSENRTNAKLEDLPQNLLDALVATEDARFYQHEGVDNRSVLRVVFKTILMGDASSGGGSTITQQLAKNLYGRSDFSILSIPVNKLKEIILANRLEELYSKEELLEFYLNTVPFSDNTYGIEAASFRFFSKKPNALHAEESAVLIGMLKASTYYNPRLHPNHSLGRRNVVLGQMQRYGYLEKEEADSLQSLPLTLNYTNVARDSYAPYFMKRVRSKAHELLEKQTDKKDEPIDIEKDGLKIYTTLNLDMQLAAQKAMRVNMAKLQKVFDRQLKGSVRKTYPEVYNSALKNSKYYKHLLDLKLNEDSLEYHLTKVHPVQVYYAGTDTVLQMSTQDSIEYYVKLLHSGFMAMQPQSGAILAYEGGLNYRFLPYDLVQAPRQAASTFKPFVYATALSMGADPCYYISNEREVYQEYDDWSPGNYDDNYEGYYSMRGALRKSINVAAVRTLMSTGINNVTAKVSQMGISSEIPNDPSIALGSASISLYEMVQGYAVFANGGFRVEPYFIEKIESASGKLLYQHKVQEPKRVLPKEVAMMMNNMLQSVVDSGTAVKLRNTYGLRNDLAGKTGTSQNYSDGWFIGYNPHLVAGSWVGASSPQVHFSSGRYGSGSAMALPIFGDFMKSIQRNVQLSFYSKASFEPLPKQVMRMMDCPDYKDSKFLDGFFDGFGKNRKMKETFKDDNGEAPKEEEGFLKRLFKKRK